MPSQDSTNDETNVLISGRGTFGKVSGFVESPGPAIIGGTPGGGIGGGLLSHTIPSENSLNIMKVNI